MDAINIRCSFLGAPRHCRAFALLAASLVSGGCNSQRAFGHGEEVACADRSHNYADAVLDWNPTIAGGEYPGHDRFNDPSDALGAPDYHGDGWGIGAVALGYAGVLDLAFEECHLVTTGDQRTDLIVYEAGDEPETLYVAVAPLVASPPVDPAAAVGDGFYLVASSELGMVEIDIDAALGLDSPRVFDRVRLVDDPVSGSHGSMAPGADIDAVEYPHAVDAD